MKWIGGFIAAALVAAAVNMQAPQRASPKVAPARVATSAPPLRAALLYDITASRAQARIETSLDDFTPLFVRLRTSGGEVGFGLIREDSDRALVRCFVPPPPDVPAIAAAVPGDGNLFVTANNHKREEAERKKYEAKHRAWELEANARINVFVAAITPLLDLAPTAPATDLTAAIERADLMLAEPSPFTHTDGVIVLITDGYHNATAKTTPTLRSNARIAVANGIGSLGTLEKLNPQPLRFESTAAAIRYLTEGGTNVR